MKLISWNINGFRSLMNRTLLDAFARLDADVYCLQETKLQAGQGELDLPGFTGIWNYADRPGYSGTAILTLRTPVSSRFGLCEDETDTQGRVITADLGDFYLMNAYAPNVAADLSRLPERVAWNDALLRHLQALDAQKPVILCGDLNAAYNDADLAGKSQGMHVPGFTREERSGMAALLQSGFVDAYRHVHPDTAPGAFAYRKGIRAGGLDYFLVSERMVERIVDANAHPRIRGSDHYPMELVIR